MTFDFSYSIKIPKYFLHFLKRKGFTKTEKGFRKTYINEIVNGKSYPHYADISFEFSWKDKPRVGINVTFYGMDIKYGPYFSFTADSFRQFIKEWNQSLYKTPYS